jgi:hypothetical protein
MHGHQHLTANVNLATNASGLVTHLSYFFQPFEAPSPKAPRGRLERQREGKET